MCSNVDDQARIWLTALKFLGKNLGKHLAKQQLSKLGRNEETPESFSADEDEERAFSGKKLAALLRKYYAIYKAKAAGRNEQTLSTVSANDDEEARKIKWFKTMKSIAKFIAKEQMKKHLGGEK
uniref:Lycosin 1c Hognin 3a 2e n=1 Tax=Hogna radiata TaxID=1296365 RepID=A0A8D8EQ20_9ARAC|nr:Lycosin 1c Hognin 3a 2e precursor [Hogna radiata]